MSKVAVFGDAMLDIYHIGTATKLSAEVPIPIVQDIKHTLFPGGAGNVVANLEALGVEVVNCTTSGPIKNRLMVGGHQIARWDTNDKCSPWEGEMPQGVDAIIISDYNKGSVPRNVQWPRDVPIFVDTKLPPPMYPHWATFFPNQAEYRQFENDYAEIECVVLKRGADGLDLLRLGNSYHHEKARARFVNSVNGAGDTVLASFIAWYLEGPPPGEECAKYASYAAGLVVEKSFTSTVTRKEIEERISDDYNTKISSKA